MEKIQDAIAKARAARAAETSAAAGETAGQVVRKPQPPEAETPQPQPQPPTSEAETLAAWDRLTPFAPKPAHLTGNRILTMTGGPDAKEFDVLRTRVLQQMRANNWRRVAITSPGPTCGKSTLALNLAFSLARQRDQRTIVAEMDMRRPSLARLLGLRTSQSFDKVLRGQAAFGDHAVRCDNFLAFATNDGPVRGAAELLQSASTGTALDEIQDRYDPTVMLFDLPPLLAADDAMAFLGHVDCVILLAAAEQTSIKQIDACERDIASQTNVMGVVLNKCRYNDPDHAYGY